MSEQVINSRAALDAYKKYLDVQFEKHKYLRLTSKNGKQRTPTQNNCLHLFCDWTAQTLNDAGLDMRVFLKDGYEIPWNEKSVKEHIWRVVQKAMTGKASTADPKTTEYTQIYEVINRKFAEHGVHVPWPNIDTFNASRKQAINTQQGTQ